MNVEYLVTGGKQRGAVTSDDVDEIDRRLQRVEGALIGKSNERACFSEIMLTWQHPGICTEEQDMREAVDRIERKVDSVEGWKTSMSEGEERPCH